MKKITISLILSIFCLTLLADNASVISMHQMVMRLFPVYTNSFIFEKIQSNTDHFELQSIGNKIKISGNNANSMAVGLNYYLKNYCMTTVSWFRRDPIELPRNLPRVENTIKVNVKVPMRFFLNYCTFGYTMTWWKWKDWERFIDWMALNGINMPLAITGQEAIWYNVWKKFGLTDHEIRSYFTGPAHLPWHRMCNVDSWQGPLPMRWIKSQKELQKKIVLRERELNMKPILPAFAGHVPSALKRIFPHLLTTEVISSWGSWGGFASKYHCSFLNSRDPLYNVIQKYYLTEQIKLYGTNHIYEVDPFNEVNPPTWKPDSLAMISSHIYQSMKMVDKDAIWLQMGWLFYNDQKHWTTACRKALVRSVPQNRMILLDYYGENTEIWPMTESFYGQPFIWCYLGNFGGNTRIYGPTKIISNRIANTFQKAGKSFKGIGATLEGLDVNMFAYEFTLDKAWNIPQNDEEWLKKLADRRLGEKNILNRQIWKELDDKVFQVETPIVIEKRPEIKNEYKTKIIYPDKVQQELITAWKGLLSIPKIHRMTYRFDIINVGRQVLECHFQYLYDELMLSYKTGDVHNVEQIGNRMKGVLKDIDKLLACDPTFSLKNWIEDARSMGINVIEKDYYEENARTILTVWGDSNPNAINDYACRGWAGLISSYYAPRWVKFIDEITDAVKQHKMFDEKKFKEECYKFEREFINPSYSIIYSKKSNAIELAKALEKKYFK